MDNVLVDFTSGINRLSDDLLEKYHDNLDDVPGIFNLMDPLPGAIEAVTILADYYDMYILSTAPWRNPSAWTDKVTWVKKYFGEEPDSIFYKRLIISHHKNLNKGDYLIDDRPNNGAAKFDGEWIHFNTVAFPDWTVVTDYLIAKTTIQI